MRIGVLSQWFDPEPGPARLPGALGRSLAARGHEVRVITGFPNYPDGVVPEGYDVRLYAHESHGPLEVRRVALYPSHDASVLRRAANYVSFAASATVFGASFFKDLDAVWVYNSPVTVALPLWRIAGRMKVPALVHVMDLWPDNIRSSGLVRSTPLEIAVSAAAYRWSSWMYCAASHVATISPGAVDVLADRGVPRTKLSYVPLWADEELHRPSVEETTRAALRVPRDRVVVLYAGNLGRTQAIEQLVEACIRYPDGEVPVEVWIAGSGVEEQSLREQARAIRKQNLTVTFLGRIQSERLPTVIASSDVLYVGLREDDNSVITMPSKIQATMAAAKPMIIAVPGDAEEIVMRAGAGIRARADSPDSVCAAIVDAVHVGREGLRRMGKAARVAYDEEFSLDAGTSRIESIIERIRRVRE